ncbi:hypothetical protein [Clostridium sp. D53t1_180928_C8]|uniref:hypothetical protein n=1 Tax=Clostridium sp. D53t1_180928_C8 TaxID=2787101 RepID=UPI001FADEB1C|nr:hypothetical protein [Clostridium sp. D53t1_180928_C8]
MRRLRHKGNIELKKFKSNKSTFIIYIFLRTIVVIEMVLAFMRGNYENLFLCILTLMLFMIPSFIQKKFHIELPSVLETIILLFIFAAEILGEICAYYVKFPFWDTMLHTINGFLAAAIGFALVDILNRNERVSVSLSPVYQALVAFCFSMTIGVLWEFFECGMDIFFNMDMQKDSIINIINSVKLNSDGHNIPVTIENIQEVIINGKSLGVGGYLDIGLIDTMKDLFVNFIGAFIFSFFGYFYLKKRGKGKFITNFIPKVKWRN